LKVTGVGSEAVDAGSTSGRAGGRAGGAGVGALDSTGVDGGDRVSRETGIADSTVEAGPASSRAGLTGCGLCVQEVSDIASATRWLVSSQSVLVQSTNTACHRAQNTVSVGNHESCKTVSADRVRSRRRLYTSSTVLAAGGVLGDLAAGIVVVEDVPRGAGGAGGGGPAAAGDAGEVARDTGGSAQEGTSIATGTSTGC
jgi:hypothetical protein